MRDPALAVAVREALHDGRIDRAAVLLAWRGIVSGEGESRC